MTATPTGGGRERREASGEMWSVSRYRLGSKCAQFCRQGENKLSLGAHRPRPLSGVPTSRLSTEVVQKNPSVVSKQLVCLDCGFETQSEHLYYKHVRGKAHAQVMGFPSSEWTEPPAQRLAPGGIFPGKFQSKPLPGSRKAKDREYVKKGGGLNLHTLKVPKHRKRNDAYAQAEEWEVDLDELEGEDGDQWVRGEDKLEELKQKVMKDKVRKGAGVERKELTWNEHLSMDEELACEEVDVLKRKALRNQRHSQAKQKLNKMLEKVDAHVLQEGGSLRFIVRACGRPWVIRGVQGY